MRRISKKSSCLALLPVFGFLLQQSLLAVTVDPIVNWGTGALPITNEQDVRTDGTLVNAFNVGTSAVTSTTVNSVVFAPYAFPNSYSTNTITRGNYNFTETPGLLVTYSNLGAAVAPFTTLSSGYQTLLASGGGADTATTMTLTISGLTTGQQYLLQIWVNDSGNSGNLSQTEITAGNMVSLDGNRTNAGGGIGQFVTGTFTATASGRIPIQFNSTNATPYLNGFQLRAVPEPTTLGLVGMAALMLLRRRTRV